ncbi:MAG: amidase family protein [Actinomycetota bacterium]
MTGGDVPEPVRAALDRYDPALGSFMLLDEDGGLEPTGSGPLDGLLVAVKDLIDVEGWPTTNGAAPDAPVTPSPTSPRLPAAEDAAVVAWLRRRGGRVIGKTALNEYAYGVTGFNPHHGWILNPRDRTRTAGGSSGGSAAAVAAGVADVGVGTDTSGSVRLPAACCGVYGFKAANGAFPMDGVTPLAPSLDVLGFFTSELGTLQRVLGIEALPDRDQVTVGELGVDVEVPPLPAEHWTVFRSEVWAVHAERFTQDPRHYGRDVADRLQLPIGDVERARDAMAAWRARFHEAVEGFDVLVGPTMDGAAPKVEAVRRDYERDEAFVRSRMLRHTPVYNALGWPALACPTDRGSIQLAARPGAEDRLLAAAAAAVLIT